MAAPLAEQWNKDLERHIRETLKAIRFGTLTLLVQDGIAIQLDKSEKIRLSRHGHIHAGERTDSEGGCRHYPSFCRTVQFLH